MNWYDDIPPAPGTWYTEVREDRMTLRQYYIGLAMHALLSTIDDQIPDDLYDPDTMARNAVRSADAVIRAMNQDKEG